VGGREAGNTIFQSQKVFFFLKQFIFNFWVMNKKQRSCDDWGAGAQHPFFRINEPKKTGARSARARTRGPNPLVLNNFVCRAGLPQRCFPRPLFVSKYIVIQGTPKLTLLDIPDV
jgi:hypothetical protein